MENLAPKEGVDVWMVSLSEFYRNSNPDEYISAEEKQKALRFRFEHLQQRALAGAALRRLILARYLGSSPSALTFGQGQFGKPFLSEHRELHFNISHSEDVFLCGVTAISEIGVDVESIHELHDAEAIAERYYSVGEQADLSRQPTENYLSTFFHYWTRKEAFSKALGKGINLNFSSFDTSSDQIRSEEDPGAVWHLQTFTPFPEYLASVCLKGAMPKLTLCTSVEDLLS